MDIKQLIGNFSIAVLAQAVYTAVGVLASLFIPKMLGIAEFGYYQLFTFYAGYVGFFHLGLNDGIYLVHGGKCRNEIDKKSINSQFIIGLAYQSIFAVFLVAIAIFGGFGEDRVFVIVATGAFLIISNTGSYFGSLFQAMNETRLYSATVALNGIAYLAPLTILLALGCPDYKLYIVFYALARMAASTLSFVKARDFLSAGLFPLAESFAETWQSIKIGSRLMIANIVGMLILGIARFLADAEWDIEVFGKISFALSIVMFFMTFVQQASMVLFPALRQTNNYDSKRFFLATSDIIDLLLPLIYVLYFPAIWCLSWWLPQYESSFQLFAYLLPLCVYDAKTDLVGNTYLKVLRKETQLLKINVATLAISAIACLFATYIAHSIDALVLSGVICVALRSLVIDTYICHLYQSTRGFTPIVSFVISAIFIACSATCANSVAFAITVAVTALSALASHRKISKALATVRDIK